MSRTSAHTSRHNYFAFYGLSSPNHLTIRQLHSVVVSATKSAGFGVKQDKDKLSKEQGCRCGSRIPYKDCCEKYHIGKEKTPSAELTLRARFSAYVKGNDECQQYVVSTFHPNYLKKTYPDLSDEAAAEKLRLDVRGACKGYEFSGFKVLKVEQGSNEDECFVEFRYKSQQKATERRTNSRNARVKAAPVDRNFDGSVKIQDTVERSKFICDAEHGWRFAEFELLEVPEWMKEGFKTSDDSKSDAQEASQAQPVA